MSITEVLIQSFIKIYPKIGKVASKIQGNYNLIANYPLTLRETSANHHAIISDSKIHKGNDILLLSA
jgi:hypothetical protein